MPILRFVAVVVAAAISFSPVTSAADTLFFYITDGSEVSVQFGLLPLQVHEQVHEVSCCQVGFAHLVSGPLVDLDVDAVNGITKYSYGPGALTLTLTLEDRHLNLVTGTLTAVTSPFSFTVCEGCDSLFGNSNAPDFEIDFVSGAFDASFAHAMGFDPNGNSGTIGFGLEDIDGDPTSNERLGFDHRGIFDLELNVVVVPEPAALLLLLTGGGAWLARRRRARRA